MVSERFYDGQSARVLAARLRQRYTHCIHVLFSPSERIFFAQFGGLSGILLPEWRSYDAVLLRGIHCANTFSRSDDLQTCMENAQ